MLGTKREGISARASLLFQRQPKRKKSVKVISMYFSIILPEAAIARRL
jgi:hypothetical protein